MKYDWSKSSNGQGNHSGRRPWEVPDCPECDVEIYVDNQNSGYSDCRCQKCDEKFNEDKSADVDRVKMV